MVKLLANNFRTWPEGHQDGEDLWLLLAADIQRRAPFQGRIGPSQLLAAMGKK